MLTDCLSLKRALDILLCLLLLPVALAVGLCCAVFVLLFSGGPVLYGQKRVGRDGRQFTLWKFRTMVPDAEGLLSFCLAGNSLLQKEWEHCCKLHCDPRVTSVGAFLRRTSLDELPQIANILLGDMSLVGPRPMLPCEVHRYGYGIADYMSVRPGLTGLWQVSGRTRLSFEQRAALDREYVGRVSVLFDLWILLRTPLAVWRGN